MVFYARYYGACLPVATSGRAVPSQPLGSRVLHCQQAHLKTERLRGHAVGDAKIALHRTTGDVFKLRAHVILG